MAEHENKDHVSDTLEAGMDTAGDIANNAYNHYKDRQNAASGNTPQRNNSSGNSTKSKDSNSPSKVPDSPQPTNNTFSSSPNVNAGTAGAASGTGTSVGTSGASSVAGTAAGASTGTAAGAATGAAAGTAAGAAAGAGAGATAGATIGTAVGPLGTVTGAVVGGVASSIIKWIVISSLLFLFCIAGIVEELVPNLILKPVGEAVSLIKGIVSKVTDAIHNFINFFTGNDTDDTEMVETLEDATQYCVDVIDEMLESAYEDAREEVQKLCEEKGYDYQTSIDSLGSEGGMFNTTNYAFIISTYSVTTDFNNVTIADFKSQLRKKLKITYTLSTEEKEKEEYDPVMIPKYEATTVRICVDEDEDEEGNTEHDYANITVYKKTDEVDKRPDGTGYWISNLDGEEVTNYVPATLYPNSGHDDDILEDYYILGSTVDLAEKVLVKPTVRTVKYADVTLSPFKNEDVYTMFDVDPDGIYMDGYETTNRQIIEARMRMIENIVNDILTTAHSSYGGQGLTQEEIEQYLANLPEGTSGNRKEVIKTALTLVGMVPYYYGGKAHNTGWNDNWWSDCAPDLKGRTKWGLDCSGYVQWCFATAGFNGGSLDSALASTASISQLQYIEKDDLLPGDIGLIYQGDSKHTGIYMGNDTWIHCSSSGTVVISQNYNFPIYKRYHPSEMGQDNYYKNTISLYNNTSFSYSGDQWYFIAQVILQECSTNTEGTIAVAECIRYRCLSSSFPNDPVSVLTQAKQFEAYSSGAYKKRMPTSDQIDLIKQVIGGTKSVLKDGRVLYFLSSSAHRSTFLTGKSWLAKSGYNFFGEYGDNAFYYNPRLAKPDISLSVDVGSSSKVNAETKHIPNNSSNNGVVYFGQSASAGGGEWARVPFGDADIGKSGCSVTCLSMVISYFRSGAASSGWVYPNDVVSMIQNKTGNYNYFHTSGGQSWDIFRNVASWYGLKCSAIASNSIILSLQQNRPVIMSCKPGEFTKKGHFIVITGIDSNGYCWVNDPSHPEKSYKPYTVDALIREGKGFWTFYQ